MLLYNASHICFLPYFSPPYREQHVNPSYKEHHINPPYKEHHTNPLYKEQQTTLVFLALQSLNFSPILLSKSSVSGRIFLPEQYFPLKSATTAENTREYQKYYSKARDFSC